MSQKGTAKEMTPGQIIRAYRKELEFSLEKMSKLLYCSIPELSLIERDLKAVSRTRSLLWSTIVPHWTPTMLSQNKQEA